MNTTTNTTTNPEQWRDNIMKQEREYMKEHNLKNYCICCHKMNLDFYECDDENKGECLFEYYNICAENENNYYEEIINL